MAKVQTQTRAAVLTPPPAPRTQEVIPAAVAKVPAHLQARLAESDGRGISTSRDDNILPLIYVLQTNSPCVDERSEAYVPGARPGEFWVRGTAKLFSGKEGVVVQPCAFLKCWIEWGPKRGDGFKGRHEDRPEDAKEREVLDDQGQPRTAWVRPSGNIVVETREHYVIIEGNPYVLSFTSTGHTTSRTWMALLGSHKDERGRPYDAFSRLYRMTTVPKSNNKGKWYGVSIVDAKEHDGWVPTVQAFDLGAALYDAVMSGEKRAEEPSDEGLRDDAASSDSEARSAGI